MTSVTWQRVSRAAHQALFDIQTLIPTVGAVIFAAAHLDGQVSDPEPLDKQDSCYPILRRMSRLR
jgi:hypothetical protein